MVSASNDGRSSARDTVDSVRAHLTRTRPLAPRSLPDHAPERVGRYTIRRRLGVGGMGVVYEAFDERVGRAVALKLMLRGDADVDRERLRREAQALARLSHPHVVEVFEIGEHHDPDSGEPPRPYVAMELVEGHPLDRWLRLRPRSPAEIVGVFVQAGEGLAAAHAHGLVHRDFKPGNVLVGDDGRVRVVDFGLVRESDVVEPSTAAARSAEAFPLVAFGESLTRTGATVGTPAYMSPEQLTRLPVGPKSDQFGFCVALYEALHGQHPFVGDGEWSKLPFNVLAGAVVRPPRERRVPGRLTRAILRGLAVHPEERWPSMDALLSELRWALARRGPRPVLAALVVSMAGLGLWMQVMATPRDSVRDDAVQPMIGELPAVERYGAALDDVAQAAPETPQDTPGWRELVHVDALLEAGNVDQARPRLEALLDRAGRESNAVLAAEVLLRVGRAQLRAGNVEPAREVLEQAYLEAKRLERDRLAAEAALALLQLHGGRNYGEDDAARWARHARAEIDKLDDPRLTHRFHHAWGRALVGAGDVEQALAEHDEGLALVRSLPDAEDDELATSLLHVSATLGLLGRFDEGRRHAEQALQLREAALGPRHPRVAANLMALGGIAFMEKKHGEALARYEQALSILQEHGPDDPAASFGVLLNISSVHRLDGRPQQAADALRLYLDIVDRAPEPDAVDPARLAWVRGEIAMLERRYADALVEFERAALGEGVQRYEETRGLLGVAMALYYLGRLEESVSVHRRVLELLEPRPGTVADLIDANDRVATLQSLARSLDAMGDHHAALAELELARTLVVALPDPADAAVVDVERGAQLGALGRSDEALPLLRAAVPVLEAAAVEPELLVAGLVALGEAELATGDREAAREHAERAVSRAEEHQGELLPSAARAWFLLARSLGTPPDEQTRAQSLAQRAQAQWASEGTRSRRNLERAQAFTRAQR